MSSENSENPDEFLNVLTHGITASNSEAEAGAPAWRCLITLIISFDCYLRK